MEVEMVMVMMMVSNSVSCPICILLVRFLEGNILKHQIRAILTNLVSLVLKKDTKVKAIVMVMVRW